ncbi:MAG: hypothetical protein ACTSR2_05470 [Candidatus Hodarchaeales archaeon]
MYTALVVALSDIEEPSNYSMSGIYGYRIPDNEGIGLFTVQKSIYRIFFLCEGLYGRGIPSIRGKISEKLEVLFEELEKIVTPESCELLHQFEESDTFWFDLVYSKGFGENIPLEEIEYVFPLLHLQIKIKSFEGKKIEIESVESVELGSLGYGWKEVHELLAGRVQAIFNKPDYSFLIYRTLFIQISEFVQDFEPNTIILTYQTGKLQENVALIAFLSLKEKQLDIRYCLPIAPDIELEGSRSIHSYLRSLILEP